MDWKHDTDVESEWTGRSRGRMVLELKGDRVWSMQLKCGYKMSSK